MFTRRVKSGRLKVSVTNSGKAVALLLAAVLLFSYYVIRGYYSAKYHYSYLPEIIERSGLISAETFVTCELSNSWYKLKATESGEIRIENPDGDPILANLGYVYEYANGQGGSHLSNISVSLLNDSIMTINGSVNNDVNVSISLTVCQNRPKMIVTVKTCYMNDLKVIRESLVAEITTPVSEIYLKNCSIGSQPFSNEYWLDKQGVRFGEGSASAMIYHTPGISSLQLKRKERLLIINLDYALDHPFIKIPYQPNGEGKWNDISASQYRSGDIRLNNFEMQIGMVPEVLPRLLNTPGGFIAGYIFTEHADGGTLRTHRAAYYGSENIKEIQDATGGFSGHHIPVTKSVFYEDFDDGLKKQADSINDEAEYLEFLDQLYLTGNELCLHTPEGGNSTRDYMREAIQFMKERYDTKTWIDHGMFQGSINRESFSADGLDSLSQYYAADLWKEAHTQYFWSPAVEAIRYSKPLPSLKNSLKTLKFLPLFTNYWERYDYLRFYTDLTTVEAFGRIMQGSFPMLELNSQRPIKGHSFPTPLYWQNPTYSGDFYSWPTEFDYNGITRQIDSANFTEEKLQLDLLIENRGVFYNHGYYVRNSKHDGTLAIHDGELIINPYFDSVLKYMDMRRNEGSLLLTTVSELMDYRLQINNIKFDYKPDGSIDILNSNQQMVNGLALALHCNPDQISLKGSEFKFKKVDDDTVIWFDLPAGTIVSLSVGKTVLTH